MYTCWLTRAGARLLHHTLLKRVRLHGDRLALPVAVTPHSFRRSCTTELIRGGANLWHVKELLGHEHLDTLQHPPVAQNRTLIGSHRLISVVSQK